MGKRIRKEYERGETDARMRDIRDWTAVPQEASNALSGFPIDNLIVDPNNQTEEPLVMWIQSSQKKKGGVKTRRGLVPCLGERMEKGGGTTPLIVEDSDRRIIDTQGRRNKKPVPKDVCPTLRREAHGNLPMVLEDFYRGRGARVYEGETPAIRSGRKGLMVMDSDNRIKVAIKHKSGKVPQGYSSMNSVFSSEGISPTLRSIEDKGKMILESNKRTSWTGTSYKILNPKDTASALRGSAQAKRSEQDNFVVEKNMNSDKPIKVVGNIYPSGGEAGKVVSEGGLYPTVKQGKRGGKAGMPLVALNPFGRTTTTGTPARSTANSSGAKGSSRATSGQSTLDPSPTTTFSPRDFLARVSQSQGEGGVSRMFAERYSMRFSELRRLKDPRYSSLKTLRDYYQHRLESAQESIRQLKERERESLQAIFEESKRNPAEAGKKLKSLLGKATASTESSRPFSNWGICESNGKYLTANITGSRRTGSGSSLSDILEVSVDEKYFLSQKMTDWLMAEARRKKGLAGQSMQTTGRDPATTEAGR